MKIFIRRIISLNVFVSLFLACERSQQIHPLNSYSSFEMMPFICSNEYSVQPYLRFATVFELILANGTWVVQDYKPIFQVVDPQF